MKYTAPPNPIPSTVHPKVRILAAQYDNSHKHCWRLDHSGPMTWAGLPGDLKLCPHSKIMVRTEIGLNSRMAGPGTDYWQTLSPFWNPIAYRRAKRRIEGNG